MRKFTLVEILVVVVIILILAGIVLPAMIEEAQTVQEKVKLNEVFRANHDGNQYEIIVYKFEYEGESYLISNNGGIVRIEKKAEGEVK